MDYSKLNIYQMMQTNMRYLSERQGTLAKNVANADTPDFVGMDIKRPDFKKQLKAMESNVHIDRTHKGHMTLNRSNTVNKLYNDESNFELTPVENGVSLDEQILKINETAFAYQTTTNLYRKTNEMMKVALGSGAGGQ